jgi:hypothetical protein
MKASKTGSLRWNTAQAFLLFKNQPYLSSGRFGQGLSSTAFHPGEATSLPYFFLDGAKKKAAL